jgi:hypothetical protein
LGSTELTPWGSQLKGHPESLERQYELAARAEVLAWAPRRVVNIDDDLGRSGAESSAREGFKIFFADEGFDRVGMILAMEVSPLARNNATGISGWIRAR